MERRVELQSLIEALTELVGVLRLDPKCGWRLHFESCLHEPNKFLEKGFSQDELSRFSTTVMFLYGGAGSFNDYAPGIYDPATGRYAAIPGMEKFEQLSTMVYSRAHALRVVGTR